MRKSLAALTCVLATIAVLALPAHAQRGGGGGGRNPGMNASTLTKTFDSPDKAVGFVVPPDVRLFTPDSPGKFGQIFDSGYMAYLINPLGGVTVGVKAIPGATQADLNGLRQTLDTNPPQAKQPGYKKLSLGDVKLGTSRNKDAVDYIYTAEVNKKLVTTREVMFVHGDKGYRIICTAPEKDFSTVNKRTFDTLLQKMDFR